MVEEARSATRGGVPRCVLKLSRLPAPWGQLCTQTPATSMGDRPEVALGVVRVFRGRHPIASSPSMAS